MKNRLLAEVNLELNSSSNYTMKWKDGTIKWITPKKVYLYKNYKEKDFDKWYSLLSKAGWGHKYEKDRRNIYGNFQKEHRLKSEEDEEYNLIDKIKNSAEFKRRQKEKEYADEH